MMGYMERAVVQIASALERLADAAMIAARAYEHSVKEDFGYDPGLEDD
jgi:hypothetical protein